MFVTTRFQFRFTRCSASSSISLLVPKWIAPVGQVFTPLFPADADAIDAERAFIYPVILFVEARNIKRTPGNAVTTADAVFRLEIDNPVSVLNDCTSRRARLQAAGSSQCIQPSLRISHSSLPFCSVSAKAHHRPGLGAQDRRGYRKPRRSAPLHHGCRST